MARIFSVLEGRAYRRVMVSPSYPSPSELTRRSAVEFEEKNSDYQVIKRPMNLSCVRWIDGYGCCMPASAWVLFDGDDGQLHPVCEGHRESS